MVVMHQSFETPTLRGPGNSGAFNFSVCKTLVNICTAGTYGEIPAKSPCPHGGWMSRGCGVGGGGGGCDENNKEQQMN